MQLITNLTKLDWSAWLVGILGAIISGGAGAVGSLVGVTAYDPNTFNTAHPGALLKVMGITFIVSAIISLAKYLQLHPTPQAETLPAPAATK